MQRPSDGDRQPLPDGLRVALVEQVCGGAVLGADAVLQGLGQKNGTGTDCAICKNKMNWEVNIFM